MGESDMTISGLFAIKVRVGSAEIEVSAPEKDFVLDESSRLIEQFILTPITSSAAGFDLNGEAEFSVAPDTKPTKSQNLVEFLKQFNGFQTNLDKILALGYWCEMILKQANFTAEDIQAKYKEIRELKPANLNRDLESLKKKGFLMPPERSDDGQLTYTLSSSGIKEIEAKMSQA